MAGVEGSRGFYTFVRHFGKMGPPSSLLFLISLRLELFPKGPLQLRDR